MELIKPKRISIKGHPTLDEKWVQDRIAEDPSILGLGDLDLRDKERVQPRAGRLDLLLQDAETNRRYEVEVQLGAADESHIIRTLEYWDIERKRYPQYDHCAVLVAEDVTSRFLNVISLFNGHIPIIALQMAAYDIEGKVALIFTRVIDEMQFGLVDEDESVAEEVDRGYWEAKSGKEIVAMADRMLEMARDLDGSLSLKYNKYYIGLKRADIAFNFVMFKPKKKYVLLHVRVPRSEDIDQDIESSDLDAVPYSERDRCYRFRVLPKDLGKQEDFIRRMIKRAYDWRSE